MSLNYGHKCVMNMVCIWSEFIILYENFTSLTLLAYTRKDEIRVQRLNSQRNKTRVKTILQRFFNPGASGPDFGFLSRNTRFIFATYKRITKVLDIWYGVFLSLKF